MFIPAAASSPNCCCEKAGCQLMNRLLFAAFAGLWRDNTAYQNTGFGAGNFFYLLCLNQTNMDYQLVSGRPDTADYLVFTTTFIHKDVFYKAALAETISWEGLFTGTYDVLLQSGKGTQRLTLIHKGEQWKTGEEIEQIGRPEQEVVDLLGAAISAVRK